MIAEFQWQDYQGRCPNCGYVFLKFTYPEKKKSDFKYCIGFVEPMIGHYGMPYVPDYDSMGKKKLVIGFECPECFEKSGFHVNQSWRQSWGKWIKPYEVEAREGE